MGEFPFLEFSPGSSGASQSFQIGASLDCLRSGKNTLEPNVRKPSRGTLLSRLEPTCQDMTMKIRNAADTKSARFIPRSPCTGRAHCASRDSE